MSMPAERLRPHMTLGQLLEGMDASGLEGAAGLEVTGIATDSRRIVEGDVFLACQGESSHGLDYLEQAIARGAAAVAFDTATASATDASVPMVGVRDLSSALGTIANRFYDTPSRDVRVTGITGTNGKTTVAWLIRQCLGRLGQPCGYIGTLGYGVDDMTGDASMTTPACVELHALLADFRSAGAKQAAIEVSSHALEQKRVDGMRFGAAIFTNLTRDHMDYHGSMRAYGESKASLFLDYDVDTRIVSLDTDFGTELADRCGPGVITVSTRFDRVANGRPYVFVRSVVATPQGSNIAIKSAWGDVDIALPLPGEFNVANAAQVLALLLSQGIDLKDARAVLETVSAPAGRMQRIDVVSESPLPQVYVDYSHTPASLEAALKALRAHSGGRLWCVFGCGGDRDRGKRALMGRIASRLADHPIVTSDNPRTEPPGQIIAEVLEGMAEGSVAIEDRGTAILHAVREAAAGDTVLVAGKGHENYQVIGRERLAFSDADVARAGLEARAAGIDGT